VRYHDTGSHHAARALGPRDAITTLGMHRRSRAPYVIASLTVIALAGGLTWWLATRPAAATITSVPEDAVITLSGVGKPARGMLVADKLEPGTYTVSVERKGFEAFRGTVELTRGRRLEQTFTLVPRPIQLSFATRPTGAAVTVAASGGGPFTGVTPYAVTAAAGTVTVTVTKAGYNPFTSTAFLDEARSFDLLLDPKGQLVHALGSIVCSGAPKGVALTPDGKEAWSAILNGPPSIQIFEPRTGRRIGDIDLGKAGAVEVIFNKAGTLAYASQMETTLKENSKVFEIDVKTRAVKRTFDTESKMTKVVALSPDEKTVYSANWAGNDVSVIDLATGKVKRRIPVAKTPRGLWPTADGKYLYVAGFDAGELERIDLLTSTITLLFKSGGAMRHLVADEKRGLLYASDMGKDAVWVHDMKAGTTTKFCDTDHKPNTIDLSPDGRVLFISNRGANNPKSYYLPGYEWGSVLLYDTQTAKPLDAVVGGNQCTALDVSEDGATLVFSDFLDDRLRVYEVPAYKVLAGGAGGRYTAHFADLLKKTAKTGKPTVAAVTGD
jgi:YVTN family beta-propeller protein